jgi:hypothetical protein
MKVCVLVTALLLMTAVIFCRGDEKTEVDVASDSKIYVVYVQTSPEKSFILEAVETVDFKGLKCLKGRHADISWAKDQICYIPIDKIDSIVEVASLEKYKQAIQAYREAQLK